MTHQIIDVEGLPEGWKAVSIDATGCNFDSGLTSYPVHLKVEKIQPRRIVLEETEEDTDPLLYQPIKIGGLCVLMLMHNKIWRIVKE